MELEARALAQDVASPADTVMPVCVDMAGGCVQAVTCLDEERRVVERKELDVSRLSSRFLRRLSRGRFPLDCSLSCSLTAACLLQPNTDPTVTSAERV